MRMKIRIPSKISYEKTECGRCGGTGHYAFNPMNGTLCFRCEGRKTVLTKKGAAAQATVRALLDERTEIRVEEIEPGMRIRGLRSDRKAAPVERIEQAIYDAEKLSIYYLVGDGRGGTEANCFTVPRGSILHRQQTPEIFAEMAALAESLEGAEVEYES